MQSGRNEEPRVPTRHEVKTGECVSSIAAQYGLAPLTLWLAPDNAALKEQRKDPNVLLAGDVVVIPEKQPKQVTRPTGQIHRFRRRGIPPKLRLRLLRDGQPRSGEPYRLEVDGQVRTGTVPSDGVLEAHVPASAQRASLTVGEGEEASMHQLQLGYLDPSDTVSGLQSRLINLGWAAGPVTGEMDPETRAAAQRFLEAQGKSRETEDEAALQELARQAHGC